jgi:hypothetical protein
VSASTGLVSKGPVLDRLDRYCARREHVERLWSQLVEHEAPERALDFAHGEGGEVPLLSYRELRHLTRHWLPEAGEAAKDAGAGWWPQHRPLWPVLRRGLAHACRLSLTHAPPPEVCPLDFYWVATGTDVQVVSCLAAEHRAVAYDESRVDWIWAVRHGAVAPGEHSPRPGGGETVVVQPHWPATPEE